MSGLEWILKLNISRLGLGLELVLEVLLFSRFQLNLYCMLVGKCGLLDQMDVTPTQPKLKIKLT